MKSIAFSIQKGGQGKTSLSGNIAHIVSENSKVLLVDGDPQASLSSWLLNKNPEYELSDVLQGKTTLSESIIQLNENLFILPTFGVGGNLRNYADNRLDEEPYIFDELKEEAMKLKFNFMIYDLSPAIGRLERSIILGSDEVITPLTPEYLSLDGIEIFTDFLERVRKGFKRIIKHEKIVINLMNEQYRRHKIYRDKINSLNYEIFEVGQDKNIPESQMFHKSLIDFEPKSRAIPELKRLATALTC